MQNLEDALGHLYRAFSNIAKPRHIDGCPCCLDDKDVAILLGKELRAITPCELSSYASSAFLTVGAVADYRYFLPRILEVTAKEPWWWPDPEVTGRAILSSQPETWTEEQRAALTEFLQSVVVAAIHSGEYDRIDRWICAISRMGLPVRPYLDQVADCPAAVLAYFDANAEGLPRMKLANAYWELPCPAHDTVVEWFYSAEIAKIPFEAYGYVLTPVK